MASSVRSAGVQLLFQIRAGLAARSWAVWGRLRLGERARLVHQSRVAMTESLFAARLRSRLVVIHRAPTQRSVGLRHSTWFPVLVQLEQSKVRCQVVEASATGIVLEHAGGFQLPEHPTPLRLELLLRPTLVITVLARPIRQFGGRFCALKFVAMSDVDRLSLMEHLDREERETKLCLESLVAAAKPLC